MNVLLLNGSPNAGGCTYTALCEIAGELKQAGIASELVQIGKKPVAGCIACYRCTQSGDGHCVLGGDIANEVIDKIKRADGLVVGSPVYYAGIAGQLKSLLDRVFFAGSAGFANKPAAGIVSCRRGGASSAFDQLGHYFTICKMHVVSSQYWNQVHGSTPDEVRQDLEGLQTMRTLARNMAWLLGCMEQGDAAGIQRPVYEPVQPTNFIRHRERT